jgi:hypothetical protein
MTHSKRTKPSQNSVTSLGQHAVSAQPHSAVRQKQLASPGQAEFALCEQTILAVSRPIMVMLMVGGSPVAGSDNPQRGTSMPLGPSTPSEVQAVLDRSGFPYRYLPSYSPDLSPIEPGWAKVKSYLRRVAARTVEALQQALAPALDSITAQDAAAFFRHCGYAYPN